MSPLLVHRLGSYRDHQSRPTGVASALQKFKYDGDRACGHALVRLAADYCCGLGEATRGGHPVVIPVPISRSKLRRRGFNQAAWIARGIATRLRLSILPSGLRRTEDDAPQAGRPGWARRRQAASLFAADADCVDGRDVILVDDVVTTGTTLVNCSSELLRAGANHVQAVTLLGVPVDRDPS